MKLDIGSGERKHSGYTSIDIEEYNHPDIVGDFRTMQFSGIEEIRAHHILEHFSREESIAVLQLWHSWLAKDGVLILETPDIEGICDNFRVDPYWMLRHAFGSQEHEWAFHRDGWYEDKFRTTLPNIGFEIIGIKKTKSRKILPNITVVAKKI